MRDDEGCKAVATTNDKQGLAARVQALPEFVQQVRTESGKIAWPTRRETLMTAVMVVIMTTVLGLFFFGVDQVFNLIVQFLLSLVA